MTSKQFYALLGDLDDSVIAEAQTTKKPHILRRWVAAAACLCLVAAVLVPTLSHLRKGGSEAQGVEAIAALKFNGCFYEAVDLPEVLERFGLPGRITPELAGDRVAWLEREGSGYRPSPTETDAALYQFAPSPCRGVYVLRDSDHYGAALFCNFDFLDGEAATPLSELYRVYGIEGPGDIVSVAEMNRNRTRATRIVTDPKSLEDFYELTIVLDPQTNGQFQAQVFDPIPEEDQPQAHDAWAEDRRELRVETRSGLRFFLAVYPSYGWLEADGTLSYYPLDEATTAWLETNLP